MIRQWRSGLMMRSMLMKNLGSISDRLVSGFAVENLFQKIYTDTKFQEVQTECCRLMYYYPCEESTLSETLIRYLIEDRVWIVPEGKSEAVLTNRRKFHSATFHNETKMVCCDCRKFETDGIICRHIIRILDLNQVVDIPQRYILTHWRKDVLRKHTRVKVSKHDPSKTGVWKRYNTMMIAFELICEEAAMVDDETITTVLKSLEQLQSAVGRCSKRKFAQTVPISFPDDATATVEQNDPSDNGTTSSVHNPFPDQIMPNTPSGLNGGNVIDFSPKDPVPKKRGRGRPKGSRNKGLAEIGYKRPNNNRKVPQPATDVDGAEDKNLAPRPKKISVRRAATPQVPQHENEVQYIAEDDSLVARTSTCA